MMLRFLTAVAISGSVLGAFIPQNASAACVVALENTGTLTWEGRGGGYDPFDPVGYSDRFTFQLVNLDPTGEECAVVVRIEPVGPSRLDGPGTADLDYAIRREQNEPTTSESLDTAFSLQPGERADVSFVVFIPPQQTAASGSHDGRLLITAFENLNGALQQRTSENIILRTSVVSSARVAFVGAVGRRQTIDFGELSSNKASSPVFLEIRSTSDFDVRLSSQERGVLVQTVGGTRWEVPYEANLGGGRIDLSSPSGDVTRFEGPTAASGNRIPLDLRLGTVGKVRAGTYRDLVTIEVTPIAR